ncbi:TRAP transporter small permease [Brevibacterium marinum]|uniref:TRAP-type C4-dicarboxylate transport system permease small subunit n=1 Tax=Brevibacterium marinum TaxID=418643 RepID=A0A846RXD9_9MICO|nr:TRAP transporter small permease [Brevibacterium marinum]NJC55303.1 TRAP-type C4-dicarboxylate transport system permease small subunit [Brevibacterium marinum]
MKVFDRYLSRVENVLAGGSLIAATVLAVFAVLLRNLTGDVLFWSEEAIIYLIICSTFFGAVVTLRHNEHVAVDIMPTLLKGRKKKFFVILGGLATLVYAGFIAYLSWALITEPFSRTTITPALKLPLWVVELSLAIGMTLFFIRAAEMLFRALKAPAETLEKDVLAEEAAAVGIAVDDLAIDDPPPASGHEHAGGNDNLGDGTDHGTAGDDNLGDDDTKEGGR